MTLRERAALGVLAGQPDSMTLFKQRTERQRLAGRPIDAVAGFDRLGAVVEEALHRAMHMKALGHHGDLLADLAQILDRYPGIAAPRIVRVARRFQPGPAAVQPIRLVGAIALAGLQLGVEPRTPVGAHLVGFAL